MSSLDYEALLTTLPVSACETLVCTNVVIVDNNIAESTENFFVSLLRTSQLDSRITLSPNKAKVEILDDYGSYNYDK